MDTPQKDSQKINPAALEPGEMIYVMPEKFRKIKTKRATTPSIEPPKKTLSKRLLIIILIILIIGGGGAGFYFWAQKYYKGLIPATSPVTTPQGQTEQPTTPSETPAQPEAQTLKFELKNETNAVVSSIELNLPAGAVDSGINFNLSGNLVTLETDYPDYKVIGGIYTIQPIDVVFHKAVNLKISYQEKMADARWEKDITLGYFKNNLWTIIPSTLDTDNNVASANLEILPADTFALIVAKTKVAPKAEEFQIAPQISSSLDSDNDGLTDTEEAVYKTKADNPDSDADGVSDGQEIINLSDPSQSGEVKLAISGLINVYTNQTYSYSFFYPASWLTRAIPETNNAEVMVITNTGEFFGVTVEDNLDKLTPADWYMKQSPKADKSSLSETTINNQPAVWSPDHLTVYIAKDDRIYILSYNTGVEREANFKTTFKMLINSFQFISPPVQAGHPDGTLIKYPDSPGIYLLEGGKKRAFKSGEIFEARGYKWENVIEIPATEVYPDGPVIESAGE